ncbi:hypothetical protein RB196_34815 [Streptomyces sp. PmtA]|uniref:hypothetical protein n=1 Tax=Streptomyces sp. PmtA TaxID=3074275 RepID=UPI00301580C7
MVAHARRQAQEWGADRPRIDQHQPGGDQHRAPARHVRRPRRRAGARREERHRGGNRADAALGRLHRGRAARPAQPAVEDPVFRDRLRKVTSRLLTHWL